VLHHRVSGSALALHQSESFVHIETGQFKLTHQGVEQRAISERHWVSTMGRHDLVAPAEGSIEFTQIEFFKTGLGGEFGFAQGIGRSGTTAAPHSREQKSGDQESRKALFGVSSRNAGHRMTSKLWTGLSCRQADFREVIRSVCLA